ncbi:MAG: ribonuclease P protein component [Paraglaciecola sp.]|uniref:ribonuclease P protein component n=1 Tax=Paraglaciecola sp. TaxID=1920173 RepID=UPI0032996DEC
MGENNFSRELRLLTPTHFEYVFNNAIPAVSPQLTLLARFNETDNPRLGITLSKKRIKYAHDRNRLKRIIRESFRLQRHSFPNIDIVVVGKSGLDKLSNRELFFLLNKLWKKLAKRCEKSQ